MRRYLVKAVVCMAILAVFVFAVPSTYGFDLSNPLFHSGITTSGHSGLLLTKGGTSIPPGKFFVGISPSFYDRDISGGASEKLLTVPLTFTYGLYRDFELAGKVTYASRDNGTSESDVSDIDLSIKWSFLQQKGSDYPSLAMGLSGKYAVADEKKGLSVVRDYGITFFLSGTALVDLGPYDDYAFSLYGEGAVVLNDWGKDYEEKHGEYNVGILLPIPQYTNVGFIVEFGGTVNNGPSRDQDLIRITPALRFNFERFDLTAGASFVNPEANGEDSYVDYILQVAASF